MYKVIKFKNSESYKTESEKDLISPLLFPYDILKWTIAYYTS